MSSSRRSRSSVNQQKPDVTPEPVSDQPAQELAHSKPRMKRASTTPSSSAAAAVTSGSRHVGKVSGSPVADMEVEIMMEERKESASEAAAATSVDPSPSSSSSFPSSSPLPAHPVPMGSSIAQREADELVPATNNDGADGGEAFGVESKYDRLHHLLDRTSLFSRFLSERMPTRFNAINQSLQASNDAAKGTHLAERARELKAVLTKQKDLELQSFQVAGVDWLISLYENGLNGILADEMGLGKTLMVLTFLAHLRHHGVYGPFLIVAPLGTLPAWRDECKRWTPDTPVLVYHGSKEERAQLKQQFASAQSNSANPSKEYPLVVTSYEIAMIDRALLKKVHWKLLCVDEGHRLKNRECMLLQTLKSFPSENRLLLTGTPISNSLPELWSLLHFLLPDVFSSLKEFQSWFEWGDTNKNNLEEESGQNVLINAERDHLLVTKLHSILRPFVLRRIKSEVLTHLPPKKEFVIYTPMTKIQRMYYQALLEGRFHRLTAGKDRSTHHTENVDANMDDLDQSNMDLEGGEEEEDEEEERKGRYKSLNNLLMQLRKVCNHPYLVWNELEEAQAGVDMEKRADQWFAADEEEAEEQKYSSPSKKKSQALSEEQKENEDDEPAAKRMKRLLHRQSSDGTESSGGRGTPRAASAASRQTTPAFVKKASVAGKASNGKPSKPVVDYGLSSDDDDEDESSAVADEEDEEYISKVLRAGDDLTTGTSFETITERNKRRRAARQLKTEMKEAAAEKQNNKKGGVKTPQRSKSEAAASSLQSTLSDPWRLVRTCGKLQFLDLLLPRLMAAGSRLLIFSQMTRTLDILEDYLVSCRGIDKYCRLDGATPAIERADMIRTFNSDPSYPVMLLSTRAGGLGLNLQSADTVLIWDSDWNPHADAQAADRVHRYSQKKAVVVFRLVTTCSVEEAVWARAGSKLKLEQVVLTKGKFNRQSSGGNTYSSSTEKTASKSGTNVSQGDADIFDEGSNTHWRQQKGIVGELMELFKAKSHRPLQLQANATSVAGGADTSMQVDEAPATPVNLNRRASSSSRSGLKRKSSTPSSKATPSSSSPLSSSSSSSSYFPTNILDRLLQRDTTPPSDVIPSTAVESGFVFLNAQHAAQQSQGRLIDMLTDHQHKPHVTTPAAAVPLK